jgi:hypothetical protein
MADPIALRILYAIRTRLYTILVADGFNTNAGENVLIGGSVVDAEEALPCVVIREGEETSLAAGPNGTQVTPTGGSTKMLTTLIVNVEGYVAAAQTSTGTVQAKLKADIKRAILTGLCLREGGLDIAPVGYLGSEPFTRDDGGNGEGVRVRFSVTYTEKFGDPDALK